MRINSCVSSWSRIWLLKSSKSWPLLVTSASSASMLGNLYLLADRIQALDDVGVDVNAVILGALHQQGLIDQIAKQVLCPSPRLPR